MHHFRNDAGEIDWFKVGLLVVVTLIAYKAGAIPYAEDFVCGAKGGSLFLGDGVCIDPETGRPL